MTSPAILDLVERVRSGAPVSFDDVISIIDAHYHYEPCRFRNGVGDDALINEPGTNQGSCKIFFFAQLLGLDQAATLALFGEFYRRDVLEHPDGAGHANIRRFMRDGWAGIAYEGTALTPVAADRPLTDAEFPRSEMQRQQPTEETTMDKPTVAQKAPYTAELEPGTYWWCACGRSARQPFCDGSHKGTSFSPVAYEVTEAKKVWFCGCKATGNAPLCDGTHNKL